MIQNTPADADQETLRLAKNVTLKKLCDITSETKKFLSPIQCHMAFLDHFFLYKSQLFIAYMNKRMPFSDSIEKLKQALATVRTDFEMLLKGAATAKSLHFRALDSKSIREEINIIVNFEEFSSYKSSSVVQHIENMLLIPVLMEGLDGLIKFCNLFCLVKCMGSSSFLNLKKHYNNKDEVEQLMTLEKATESINAIIGIIRSEGVCDTVSIDFMSLFIVLSNDTAETRDFFVENNFTAEGGNDRFQQKYGLVTQHLQHEEYNAEVLNSLYAVFSHLAPFLNLELTLHDVLAYVSKMDMLNTRAQFITVRSNIDMIKTWFSRAEV